MKKCLPITLVAILVPVLLLHLCAPKAKAFWCALGGENENHQHFTEGVLNAYVVTVQDTAGTYTMRFSSKSVEKVVEENVWNDKEHSTDPKYHFDCNRFSDSSDNLLKFKEEVITFMLDSEKSSGEVCTSLGHALHILQDFYSHSNWVELYGGVAPFCDALGRRHIDNTGAGGGTPVCGLTGCWPFGRSLCDNHESLGRRGLAGAVGGSVLTSGWYKKGDVFCWSSVGPGEVLHGYYLSVPPCGGLEKDT